VATHYRCILRASIWLRSLVLLVGGKQYAILGRND
jgi:hypothetical protein